LKHLTLLLIGLTALAVTPVTGVADKPASRPASRPLIGKSLPEDMANAERVIQNLVNAGYVLRVERSDNYLKMWTGEKWKPLTYSNKQDVALLVYVMYYGDIKEGVVIILDGHTSDYLGVFSGAVGFTLKDEQPPSTRPTSRPASRPVDAARWNQGERIVQMVIQSGVISRVQVVDGLPRVWAGKEWDRTPFERKEEYVKFMYLHYLVEAVPERRGATISIRDYYTGKPIGRYTEKDGLSLE
jgi:hypothetical protein